MYDFISNYYEKLFPYQQYVEWKQFARPFIQKSRAVQAFKSRKEKPLVVDAGCGSGALSNILAVYYDVIGIDISTEMLDQALKNYPDSGVVWLCQDIAQMNIGRKAAAVFATTDTLNHITNLNKLNAFFKRAYESLESGGYLFFDVVLDSFFDLYYKDTCSFEDFDWGSFFWTCDYNKKTQKAVYQFTCFEKVGRDGDALYRRTDEQITERVWPLNVIMEGLEKAGFRCIQVYADLMSGARAGGIPPRFSDYDERAYYVCEKP